MRPPNTILRRIARSGLPVSLIAVVALLLGGLGVSQTAWAKALIHGKDIKRGTVTGKQVKDGSIGVSDLARSARTELAGKPGAGGASGPQGVAGIAGPAGPAGERGAVGPAGSAGTQGERGPQGIKGEPGRDAASEWVRVDRSVAVVASSLPAPAVVQQSDSYRVTFARDVSSCATTVTRHADTAAAGELVTTDQLDLQAGGRAYTFTRAPLVNAVYVRLIDHGAPNGADLAPGSFTLTLHC